MATTDFNAGAGTGGLQLPPVVAPPAPRQPARQRAGGLNRLEVVPEPELRPAHWRPLRIAMIGQKGVPATFGGIEHHVEEIGARLAARGHDVTVYCRSSYGSNREAEYRGMRLCHLRTVGSKHLDAIAHSALSTVSAMAGRVDVVHYHALGPGLVAPLPKYLSGARVVLTVHGLDNERAKWGRAAKAVLGTAHWMSARVPDETVVVSRTLADHYEDMGTRRVTHVPNGVEPVAPRPADVITTEFGLRPGSYLLFVGRLVPEKAPDLLIRAFSHVRTRRRLVITGGSSFTDGYVAQLRKMAEPDPRVLFTGYAYGDRLTELYSNAAAFVLPSHLEGLPLTLLEAASYGVPIVASDIAPHLEVLGSEEPGRRLFPSGDEQALAGAIRRSLDDRSEETAGAVRLRDEILRRYQWDEVTRHLEEIYLRAVDGDPAVGTSLGEVQAL